MQPKYWRRFNVVGEFDPTGKMVNPVAYQFINEAKRKSRELQGKQLGQGLLVVIRR